MDRDQKDKSGLKGRVQMFKRPKSSDDEGDWEQFVDQSNLIPDDGLNKYRDLIKGEHTSVPNSFAYGTDGTDEDPGDSSLGGQVIKKNFSGSSAPSVGVLELKGSLNSIEPDNQPFDFAEFGVFFEDGTLASRITFPSETKDASQEWRVTYTLTLTNA